MNTTRSTKRLAGFGVVALLALAACGDDDSSSSDSPATTATSTATSAATATTVDDGGLYGDSSATDAPAATDAPEATAPAGGDAMVSTTQTDLGTILVDAGGRTLYAFKNDTDGEPSCVDGCAEAWPPALVEGELAVGDLDAAVFTIVEHPTGQQLKAGDWPLYTFAGDAAPGDVNGQGSGDVWFVVGPDGEIIE